VTYRPIDRQRLGKQIPKEAYISNNRIARQRISKQSLSTIEGLCFLSWSVPRGYKGTKKVL
jgi:hypothetical protein